MFHYKQIFRKFLLGGRTTAGAVCAAVPAVSPQCKEDVCGISKAMEDASKTESSNTCKQCQAPLKVRPSELPIYGCDQVTSRKQAQMEEPTSLEQMIGAARRELWSFYGQYKDLERKAIEIVETGKAHSETAITFLREEATTVHRAGAIGVGGLAGIIMGLRGGWFKRLLYGTTGAAAMAALCYPHESAEIGQESLQMAKYYFTIVYHFIYGDKSDVPEPMNEAAEPPPKVDEEIPEVKKIPTLNITPEEVIKETYDTVSASCSCPDPATGSHDDRYPIRVDMDSLGEMMSDIFYWGFRFIVRSE